MTLLLESVAMEIWFQCGTIRLSLPQNVALFWNEYSEAEEKGGDETRVDIMFDRLMLTDLRENVEKLDNNVFAELKNYKVVCSL